MILDLDRLYDVWTIEPMIYLGSCEIMKSCYCVWNHNPPEVFPQHRPWKVTNLKPQMERRMSSSSKHHGFQGFQLAIKLPGATFHTSTHKGCLETSTHLETEMPGNPPNKITIQPQKWWTSPWFWLMVQKSEKFTSYVIGIVQFHYVPRVFYIPNGDRQSSEPSTVSKN